MTRYPLKERMIMDFIRENPGVTLRTLNGQEDFKHMAVSGMLSDLIHEGKLRREHVPVRDKFGNLRKAYGYWVLS